MRGFLPVLICEWGYPSGGINGRGVPRPYSFWNGAFCKTYCSSFSAFSFSAAALLTATRMNLLSGSAQLLYGQWSYRQIHLHA